MKESINSFTGEYAWLSNFEPCWHNGKSVEHYFQAAKTLDEAASKWIRDAPTAKIAKRRGSRIGVDGRRITLREDWETAKVEVMLTLLRRKFALPHYKQLLLDTQGLDLIEGNTWGDTYWGVCNGVGENMLGKLLMQVREEIAYKILKDQEILAQQVLELRRLAVEAGLTPDGA